MSKQYIGPYINFLGKAGEAREFYHKVLGGTLQLYAMDATGTPKPAGRGDRIAWARLEAEGMVIVGSDSHPDYPPTVGDNVAIALGIVDHERLAKIFNALSEGGKVKAPLTKYSWGSGSAGWLSERFGITWSVSTGKEGM